MQRDPMPVLRYGENPHQGAAFYVDRGDPAGHRRRRAAPGQGALLQQPADADAAFALVAELEAPAVAIVKHKTPAAWRRRRSGHSLRQGAAPATRSAPSAAIVAANRPLDAAAAEAIAEIFIEVVIAPGRRGRRKGDPRRQEEPAPSAHRRPARAGAAAGSTCARSPGGFLVQERDAARLDRADLRVVTRRGAHRRGAARPPVRLDGLQARQVQRHRARQRTARRSASAPGR